MEQPAPPATKAMHEYISDTLKWADKTKSLLEHLYAIPTDSVVESSILEGEGTTTITITEETKPAFQTGIMTVLALLEQSPMQELLNNIEASAQEQPSTQEPHPCPETMQ